MANDPNYSDPELELIIRDAPNLIMGNIPTGKHGGLTISMASLQTLFNAATQLENFAAAKKTLTSDPGMMEELSLVRDFMLQCGRPETVAKLNLANNIRENNASATNAAISSAFAAYDKVLKMSSPRP